MKVPHWMVGVAGVFAFGAAAGIGNAAPLANSALPKASGNNSIVEKVARRECWWRDGVRHCARRPINLGYVDLYIGRPRPEAFPTGSAAWWRAMDYEGRGGFRR